VRPLWVGLCLQKQAGALGRDLVIHLTESAYPAKGPMHKLGCSKVAPASRGRPCPAQPQPPGAKRMPPAGL
jgi:hypothetical protein